MKGGEAVDARKGTGKFAKSHDEFALKAHMECERLIYLADRSGDLRLNLQLYPNIWSCHRI